MTTSAGSRRTTRASAWAVLAVAAALATAIGPVASAQAAPKASDQSAGRYIVTFTPGADRAAEVAKAKGKGAKVTREYKAALKGMAAELTATQVAELRANPAVASVVPDGVVSIATTQSPVTWGLDRLDQRSLPLSGSYSYSTTASNVTAYVIDTGVRSDHTQFTGRMAPGFDAVGDGNGTNDCNGHGTHVAGTIGGSTYGVAKGVTIVPVRVLDCGGSGYWSWVIAGIDWVAANAQKPAVANMSLGGGAYSTLDNAVSAAISKGVTFAIAAGNSNADACGYSPARTPAAITVGSVTNSDTRSSFSNFGTCVDIFAPGSSITSAWNTGSTATNTISGTSMASPHVAGVAALYLAANPTATPTQVATALTSAATTGAVVSGGTGSPNRLLFVDASFTPPPPVAPTVTSFSPSSGPVGTSVTITGTDLTGASVSFNGTAATVTSSAATSVTATVPAGATTGAISVTTSGGTTTSATAYTVTLPPAPVVSSFSPSSGPVGTSVTITGTDLTGAGVSFNGIPASVTSVSATSVRAVVPAGATTGTISVTTPGGTATSATDFTVTSLPTAPLGLLTSSIARNSARLSWSAPAFGDPIIRYEVRWSSNSGGSWTSWRSASSATAYTATSLKSNTAYLWQVRAVNAAGAGPAAQASFRTTR